VAGVQRISIGCGERELLWESGKEGVRVMKGGKRRSWSGNRGDLRMKR